MNNTTRDFKRKVSFSLIILFAAITMFAVGSVAEVVAQDNSTVKAAMTEQEAGVAKFGLIAAAIAFGFGALGAGLAIGNVGSAAMGAIAEKPEIATQALIFIALAEGLVVFGFITALMILGKI
ncbi:MAG: ATP synthase subunit C [Spirochaetia bacterium]|jgi:V/A-type H+-transporting ATPase subunit K|nr:ATP synthase subunit C [Spirochaetia bacterium]